MCDYNFDRHFFLQTETSYARYASGGHTLTWLGISAHTKKMFRDVTAIGPGFYT